MFEVQVMFNVQSWIRGMAVSLEDSSACDNFLQSSRCIKAAWRRNSLQSRRILPRPQLALRVRDFIHKVSSASSAAKSINGFLAFVTPAGAGEVSLNGLAFCGAQ